MKLKTSNLILIRRVDYEKVQKCYIFIMNILKVGSAFFEFMVVTHQ